MKRIQLLFILFLCHASSWAEQDIWTLKQCIDHALTHNIQIRQQSLQVKNQEISLNSQKMRRLPNLDAYANESFGFGRALTSNNTYANRNTQNTGFGLSTGIPVFTGFEIKNSTEKARLNLEAALKDLEKAKESLALEIALLLSECTLQQRAGRSCPPRNRKPTLAVETDRRILEEWQKG